MAPVMLVTMSTPWKCGKTFPRIWKDAKRLHDMSIALIPVALGALVVLVGVGAHEN